MVSTFHGLELGKRGLMAGQAGIATTGHNLANANTKGYSRQQVNQVTSPSLPFSTTGNVSSSQLGTGVSIESITRVRDNFLDTQYRDQLSRLEEWKVKQETLGQLEVLIGEPSDTGLMSVMDKFWSAWQDLGNNPDSHAAKVAVVEQGQMIVDTAKTIDHSMSQLISSLTEQLHSTINDANGYLQQIADLNAGITKAGPHANDLLDQRDLVVEKLAMLVPIDVNEQNGLYNIRLTSDGTSLVTGQNVSQTLSSDVPFQSGKLKGITNSIKTVKQYQGQLNDMIKGLAFGSITVEVPAGSQLSDGRSSPPNEPLTVTVAGLNGLLQLGWTHEIDEEGNARPGEAFFTGDETDFSLSSFAVNPSIKENASLLAVSLRVETVDGQQKVVTGNNDVVKLAGNLRNGNFTINGKERNVSDFFQSLVSSLGSESRNAQNNVRMQEAVMQATENRRQASMGVSLDEEMLNLVKFQHAYNAAARLVTTTDQMLDTIINRMAAR
ncbi:MAG: flagellar hook-associated protein FlgK [Bacillus sp. (in: Bacteria)]|nr:flagellar hook-associated protein FlgK [Bacillus sp. (in: firmicutes)]